MNAVNYIAGWQYPPCTIEEHLDSPTPRLLTLDFGLPCEKRCNLKCKYCFIETDEREHDELHERRSRKLTISELKKVFQDAAELGCRSAKLVGDQESTIEAPFLDFVRFVSEDLGMWLVLFTNGLVFSSDKQCERIHGVDSETLIQELKRLRVSIMLKFHSFSEKTEGEIVGAFGYPRKRNIVLERLIDVGFNQPPIFASEEEQYSLTGVGPGQVAEAWTRLGLESVLTPQCINEAERIYRLKAEKRLYVDLDPPVPVGLTRSEEWRAENGLRVSKERLLQTALNIYTINEELGIPFEGASPYFGGVPCSQLPYSLYVSTKGHIYPCCGCPDTERDGRSDFLGNVFEPNSLRKAVEANPYRIHYKKHGHAYDSAPFNSPDFPGYGIYHGCVYRDRAGDVLPANWELIIEDHIRNLRSQSETILDNSCDGESNVA